MMDDMIRGLDDSQAVRVLTTFARARLRAGGVAETEWTPELDRALRDEMTGSRLCVSTGGVAGPWPTVPEAQLVCARELLDPARFAPTQGGRA